MNSTMAGLIAGAAGTVALKVSDPKSWGASGWAADAIPHYLWIGNRACL